MEDSDNDNKATLRKNNEMVLSKNKINGIKSDDGSARLSIISSDVTIAISNLKIEEVDTTFTRLHSFRRSRKYFQRNSSKKIGLSDHKYNYEVHTFTIKNYDCEISKDGTPVLKFKLDNIKTFYEGNRCRSFQVKMGEIKTESKLRKLMNVFKKSQDTYRKIAVSEESFDNFVNLLSTGRKTILGLENSPLFNKRTSVEATRNSCLQDRKQPIDTDTCPSEGGTFNSISHIPIENTESTLENTESTLENTKTTLENTETTLENAETTLDNTETTLENTETTLDNTETTLENTESTLENTETTLDNTETTLEKEKTTLENTETTLENAKTTLDNTETTLETLDNTDTILENTETTLDNTETTLDNTKTTLENTETTLENDKNPQMEEITGTHCNSVIDTAFDDALFGFESLSSKSD